MCHLCADGVVPAGDYSQFLSERTNNLSPLIQQLMTTRHWQVLQQQQEEEEEVAMQYRQVSI